MFSIQIPPLSLLHFHAWTSSLTFLGPRFSVCENGKYNFIHWQGSCENESFATILAPVSFEEMSGGMLVISFSIVFALEHK
jgi:hypothetical protein